MKYKSHYVPECLEPGKALIWYVAADCL